MPPEAVSVTELPWQKVVGPLAVTPAAGAPPSVSVVAAAQPPLKTLGNNDVSGKPMVIKDGRFGPYVTDGETNASLRKGDTPETVTDQRACELLSERRAKEAANPTKATKKARKKATKKTAKKPASTTTRTVKAGTRKK